MAEKENTDKTNSKDGVVNAVKVKTLDEFWASMRDIDSSFAAKEIVIDMIESLLSVNEAITRKYNVLFLWTEDTLDDFELDRIYRSTEAIDKNKGILLVVHSPGGLAESAYLISKALKNATNKPFVVAVPRKAKSAATLLSLGADQVHMSKIAELGPIDPQINGLPALGMQHALDHVCGLVEQHRGASKMLATYLAKTLSPVALGYSSRVAEAAQQYGERLLANKSDLLPDKQTPATIAAALVYEYKNHGFVIDSEEATKLLGNKIVRTGTEELAFALNLHEYLQYAQLALNQNGLRIILAGRISDVAVLARSN